MFKIMGPHAPRNHPPKLNVYTADEGDGRRGGGSIRAATETRTGSVTAEVLSGSAQREILQEAETFGADLIVVGPHRHGHFERFRLGSVSHAVAIHANCSGEIVRTPRDGT